MKIEVYSDGSATTKEKPGGYGWVLVVDGEKKSEGSGPMQQATNNDAEMEAAIQGLAAAFKYFLETSPLYKEVILVSDSQLVLGWASGEYSFKQSAKIEKYGQLKTLMRRLQAKTRWVKGHSGDEHNERCDILANEARLSIVNKTKIEESKQDGRTKIGIKKTSVICVWHKKCLKVIDLENNIVEDYDRVLHGSRGSMLEIREDKSR